MDYTEGRECDLASHSVQRNHTLTGSPGERARTEEHAKVFVLVRRHNSNRAVHYFRFIVFKYYFKSMFVGFRDRSALQFFHVQHVD